MTQYRVQVAVGIDVDAETDTDAMTAAIANVRAILGDHPAWVTGIVAGITGLGGNTNAMVYRQNHADTRTLTGCVAAVRYADNPDGEPFPALFSFGTFDEERNNDGFDTMGYPDNEVFFHCEPADIELFRQENNGEDFVIVDVIDWQYEEV